MNSHPTMSNMSSRFDSHSSTVLSHWDALIEKLGLEAKENGLDGGSLDLPTVVAVSR